MNLPSVVIPVHNALDCLAPCLDSVQRHTLAGTRVRVVDDASTDPGVAPLLDEWSGHAPSTWTFQRQHRNLGFVQTVNRAIRLLDGDVVVLNSDTRVTPGWLERLARCLASDPRIATATPWTNNGEIASLPDFCQSNPVPPDPDAVGRVLGDAGPPAYPELPTAVGFCMALSRRALDAIGLFDADRFGLGYGEENDFSRRAVEAGWRNVLCDDAYVVHLGNRSFGPRGLAPGGDAMDRLLERHPDYLRRVEAFIADDPLAAHRQRVLDALRGAGVPMG